MPTRFNKTSELGTIVAATIKKAAEEISPGTSQSWGYKLSQGATLTCPGILVMVAPIASSIRSVWSREGTSS